MNNDNDDGIEDKIREAYMKTFDLLDFDENGCLDQEELMKWLTMFGADLM
jgi:Ca2+-binding EF-hand superfamily protein